MLKIFQRELVLCAAITTFVILCALAWGSPFIGTTSHSGAVLADTQQAHATIFQGTIVRDGAQCALRDAAGVLFHFDNPEFAESFAGQAVTVTGNLDLSSQTIHIQRVVPA